MRALRTEDIFARYGGEEFAVVLRGIDVNGASRLGDRLRRSVAAEVVEHEGHSIQITLSAGAASLTCCASPSSDELIAVADRRLYTAKEQGRNCIVSTG
jgi:diguanylate cyclase (GGDEF)-like protein